MTTDNDAALERELKGLKGEYERLREDKIRTEQQLDYLTQELAKLEERARAEYGTADPEELARLLADKRAENAKLVEDYRAHVQAIQAELAQLEHGGNAPDSHGGGGE